MDWTAGYASDVEYVAGFYREQSPAWLNFVCLLNGGEPVALDQPFTYCELGFGRGLTANVLAAANPGGRFYAADFNPAHVAGAKALARDAQLRNLVLLENSFEDLAQGGADLPQFDFITLHGIYTWVTAENRRHIVDFIARYLKPGGLVYISYNALPGWSAAMPLQRLLVEYADLFPNRSDLQIKGATELVTRMETAQAGYLVQNPSVAVRTNSLKTANPHYLVHEYMHKHWQPLFHADVARDLAAAKMSFAGSADLMSAYPNLCLNDERRAMIEEISNPEMRETLKDYFLNTSFRKDVFVRGSRRIGAIRQAELLARLGLVLTVPRAKTSLKIKLSIGEVDARAELYGPVFDALAERPHTLGELSKLPALAGQSMQNLAQIAALLCMSNQADFYFAHNLQAPATGALSLNRALAAQARYDDDYSALCSPLLGGGVAANYVERLFYLAISQAGIEPTPEVLARFVWNAMAPLGRRMQREGVALQSEEDNLAALAKAAAGFLSDKLPVWRQMKML
jgi:SAM-dependent methyltransferase